MTMNFETFFSSGAGGKKPRPYQERLAEEDWPETRIIPTGFGKTAAVLAAWLWKIGKRDPGTPQRLIYCLPMRTLVEQTEVAAKEWIAAAEKAFPDLAPIHLDVLIGGRSNGRRLPEWMLQPERPAILIGTQDMLVSAALMRGYGVSRYRWPVDFALLHNGTLWVFDEVQLMGAALPTSAQLQEFRRRFGMARESRTLWMSATLDPSWLKTVDFTPEDISRQHDLSQADLHEAGHLWRGVKRLHRLDMTASPASRGDGLTRYAAELAEQIHTLAKPRTNTIVFLNTVARAQAVFDAFNNKSPIGEAILVHSRFRKKERDERMDALKSETPSAGRVVITTQALEAGIDVSSRVLITELAPWSSLVQRFGRCNRYGECGREGADVFWVDMPEQEEAPYTAQEFGEAREKLEHLSACGPADIAAIAPSAPKRGAVIRRRDVLDLYDTDPDLSGFDVDVSLYVRDASDTDVRLFWRHVEEGKEPAFDAPAPDRAELCPAPIGGAKQLLSRAGVRAWVWNGRERRWLGIGKTGVFPGMTLWVDRASGG
ncbi:CRISPR-associated helicase Cas3' [Vineibacter terrae]|uniref:CRISPR-associated helicase Cas3 n=1 Tax=Vineibacter terrae TaxID=2586908 RepID=A0A5C8P874_9HYPH|nr:CRISPR-associated helicase Cas3' [Vineibacter terrae]TXL69593.1 CRISPR-associated helicase Cas3' [Vineibacter terrae]